MKRCLRFFFALAKITIILIVLTCCAGRTTVNVATVTFVNAILPFGVPPLNVPPFGSLDVYVNNIPIEGGLLYLAESPVRYPIELGVRLVSATQSGNRAVLLSQFVDVIPTPIRAIIYQNDAANPTNARVLLLNTADALVLSPASTPVIRVVFASPALFTKAGGPVDVFVNNEGATGPGAKIITHGGLGSRTNPSIPFTDFLTVNSPGRYVFSVYKAGAIGINGAVGVGPELLGKPVLQFQLGTAHTLVIADNPNVSGTGVISDYIDNVFAIR